LASLPECDTGHPEKRKADMADWIEGPVSQVIDGDTFDMRVEWVGKGNRGTYGDSQNIERIRLAGVDAPEANTLAGQVAKEKLRQQLTGKHVRCDVRARDTYGRLVCDVTIVAKRRTA